MLFGRLRFGLIPNNIIYIYILYVVYHDTCIWLAEFRNFRFDRWTITVRDRTGATSIYSSR